MVTQKESAKDEYTPQLINFFSYVRNYVQKKAEVKINLQGLAGWYLFDICIREKTGLNGAESLPGDDWLSKKLKNGFIGKDAAYP